MSEERLTFRENYLRAVRRRNPRWVPFDCGMSPGFLKKFHAHCGEEADVAEVFRFDGRWRGAGPTRRPAPDWRRLYYNDGSLPEEARISEWGVGHVYFEDTDDQRDYSPLRHIETAEEVDAYPWPDIGEPYRIEPLIPKVERAHAEGFPVHTGVPSIFETAWGLRGFERMMMDMAEDAPVARRIFERLHEISVKAAESVARSGADVLIFGSDVATQRGPLMSRALWRKYLFPVMRDLIRAAKRINPELIVEYHSCGDVSTLVDDFLETGIDVLNPCQPEAMDIFELKRRYGKVLSFHGGIGVQSVLPHGTPEEVKTMTRRTIELMGAGGGGYVCCASHMLRPEIPWENFMAMVETVGEFGHP